MNESLVLLYVIGVLLFVLALVTVFGHSVWLIAAAILRALFGSQKKSDDPKPVPSWRCLNCNFEMLSARAEFCGVCGSPKPSVIVFELFQDLAAAERQVERFHRSGKLDEKTYTNLKTSIEAERIRLRSKAGSTTATKPGAAASSQSEQLISRPSDTPVSVTEEVVPPIPSTSVPPPSVVTASLVASEDEIVIEPVPSFLSAPQQTSSSPTFQAEPSYTTPPRPPRKSFTEVLNSFMEESNIRWGEIIGGLLIIGCSTALVVSLWAEISRIPVLKFLIFTTVTAVLFGIGLYTEHRWKLPTTSRGILTIATLLVPLNFLAIAAVSSSTIPSGALVIGSELIAPAVFLCLVYFAGRVITPGCAHLLSAGVLGSSVGQLLVRHFAAPDVGPLLLLFLGAFPVACYVLTVGLALRVVLSDREIDESEVTTVFTMLGAMTFAAVLPFGLLLYKSGPVGMTMMYLAPLVTLGGLPLLATGTVLWRRINNKKLVASRTAGTAVGILGVVIVIAGMILAWPNPASIVPAALLNFAVFTLLAIALDLPVAHLLGAGCFALAYIVLFHVIAGHVSWQNLRVMSLLDVSLSLNSGQALLGTFVVFLAASDWLEHVRRRLDSSYYLLAACSIGVLSLILITAFGGWPATDVGGPHEMWIVYALYALGAFWIAWSRRLIQFSWIGSALLLFALAQGFAQSLALSFPWQTAVLAHASVCAIAAILSSRHRDGSVVSRPLNYSALLSSFIAVIFLLHARRWEVTSMEAERMFWIAGLWLVLLWLNKQRSLFIAFQIAFTSALVLSVKATLQQFEWYAYLPHAFLHPWGLQIQGTVLLLLSLLWIALRFLVGRTARSSEQKNEWVGAARDLLEAEGFSVDRFISWVVLGAFVLLSIYGAVFGVTEELAARGTSYVGWDIAGFPHQAALGIGSWTLLGLLAITMLANLWQHRRGEYALGALVALLSSVPLIAGRFEDQVATASAWRWLAAIFLVVTSLMLWYRQTILQQLNKAGWPEPETGRGELSTQIRTLLLALTSVPLLVLTIYPALRAIYYLPVQGPAVGIFSFLSDSFSYGVPLVLVALVLIGFAIRERIFDFAFLAGLLLNTTVTIVYLLSVVSVGGSMNRVVLAQALQLNAITFGLYALAWLGMRRRWETVLGEDQAKIAGRLLEVQVGIAIGLNALLMVPVAIRLVLSPQRAGIGTFAAGSYLGWLAFIVALTSATLIVKSRRGKGFSSDALAAVFLAASSLLAFSLSHVNVTTLTGLHALTVAVTLTAWLMLLASLLPSMDFDRIAGSNSLLKRLRGTFDLNGPWQSTARGWAVLIGGLATLLALRPELHDPSSDWWGIAPLLALSALAAALNWETLRRGYLYVASVLFNIAVSVWWLSYVVKQLPYFLAFVEVNIIAVSLSTILWLWLELRARRLSKVKENTSLSFHNLTALGSLSVLSIIVLVSFEYNVWRDISGLTWLAVASLGALLTACLWDQRARYAVAALYLLGVIGGALALQQLALPHNKLLWTGMMYLAIYSLAMSLVWHWRKKLLDFTQQLGIPQRMEPGVNELKWLSAFTILTVAAVAGLAYWIDIRFVTFSLRSTAALAVAAQSLTFGLFAEGRRQDRWRRTSIVAFILGAVFFGWAWLVPGSTGTWLNRSVILMVESFAAIALYGLMLNKARAFSSDWTNSARACVPWILGAGVVAMVFCLGTEVFYQISFGAVRIYILSLFAIGLSLAAAVVICVLFALSPSHDPLSLSQRGRMRYVYVAEVMLALLVLHSRLTMPWLFTGFFERYWPIVIMAIAYAGVVASEALRRRKLLVLAQPIQRTGAFLPLLPVFGFWLAQSTVDYSLLLFVVGGLYGLLSVLRRSFAFGVVAAIAGNAGLWYMLQRSADFQFLQHPQLWLIPVALSVLLAAYLNEDDFTEDQMAAIRHLALVTIYASSTADIFINGVANSPWLPLVLGAFSLAGVFSGIIFRIRGLLLLGSVFLLLAIITMIWYASANLGWTWLWYVAGIVTGATIIFMFALFEKKRGEVLRVVEGLKDWDR
jgi:hypothetical protein